MWLAGLPPPAHLRVAHHLEEILGHRHARSLAVDADDSARPLTVGALHIDRRTLCIRSAHVAQAQAVTAQDLARAITVDALETILDLLFLDHGGNDCADHADAAPDEAIHSRLRERHLTPLRNLQPWSELVHASIHGVHVIELEAIDNRE